MYDYSSTTVTVQAKWPYWNCFLKLKTNTIIVFLKYLNIHFIIFGFKIV